MNTLKHFLKLIKQKSFCNFDKNKNQLKEFRVVRAGLVDEIVA